MNTRTSSAFCLATTLLGSVALAQTVTTDTNYAVFATAAATTAFDGVASGTVINDELELSAKVRQATGHHRRTLASASTDVEVDDHGDHRGVDICEEGSVNTRGATGKFSAGTSADAPGTTAPTQGAHSIHLVLPAAAGTAGVVTIDWEAEQTAGATVTSSVDVNDDGTPDFTGVGNVDQRVTINVTAGTKGFTIHITTSGSASINGIGSESYEASLEVGVETSRFSFTAVGPECLGELTGSTNDSSSNARINFVTTGAAANGFGILTAGPAAAAPLPLPAGTCQMLVDPTSPTLLVFLTDASGNATAQLRTRLRNTTIDVQVLTLGFVAGAIGTTNAVRVIIN